MKASLAAASAAILSLCLLLGTASRAQDRQDQAGQVQPPKPSSNLNKPLQRMDLKHFPGKIEKSAEGRLVLLNSPTMINYELDNRKLAETFIGKEVTVEGQLIPPGGKIHVRNIVRAP